MDEKNDLLGYDPSALLLRHYAERLKTANLTSFVLRANSFC